LVIYLKFDNIISSSGSRRQHQSTGLESRSRSSRKERPHPGRFLKAVQLFINLP